MKDKKYSSSKFEEWEGEKRPKFKKKKKNRYNNYDDSSSFERMK